MAVEVTTGLMGGFEGWIVKTGFGFLFLIVGYLIASWKRNTDKNLDNLKDNFNQLVEREATCKLNISQNFVMEKNCDTKMEKIDEKTSGIFKRLDELKDMLIKINYELGYKNGNNATKRD